MAKVIIAKKLEDEIDKKFKDESVEVLQLLRTLEDNPHKGKEVGSVNGVLIKELKYKKFRFYFVVDGYSIKVMSVEELKDLIIKFMMMSEKKNQVDVILKLKEVLRGISITNF